MFDPKDFVPIQADADQVLADLDTKARDSAKRIYQTRDRMKKELPIVLELVSKATLPAEAEVRLSASESGMFTFTISKLETFHDITELTAVFQAIQPMWSRAEKASHSDDIENKCRSFYYSSHAYRDDTPIKSSIRIRAYLDAEAAMCKVFTGVTKVSTYTDTTTDRELVCPGDPRYDDL